jgi:hypothetical protein
MIIAINEHGFGFATGELIFTVPYQYMDAYFADKLYEYFGYQFSVIEDRRTNQGRSRAIFARTIGSKAILESEDTPKF